MTRVILIKGREANCFNEKEISRKLISSTWENVFIHEDKFIYMPGRRGHLHKGFIITGKRIGLVRDSWQVLQQVIIFACHGNKRVISQSINRIWLLVETLVNCYPGPPIVHRLTYVSVPLMIKIPCCNVVLHRENHFGQTANALVIFS